MATVPTPPPSSGGAPTTPLNVIGLISGGKDSFFGLLHCLAHGHRIVALANLHPDDEPDASDDGSSGQAQEDQEDQDYDSFMYQTVGHQVVPLYAAATGLPLYRQKILGRAVHSGRDYYAPPPSRTEEDGIRVCSSHRSHSDGPDHPDETESMTSLLRRVRAAHPEANAVCAGALLSNYQRTRVESVAVRLGLVSVAYLWKYPLLSFGGGGASDYLADLAAAGFDARIVKVASGGLDDALLWANVASTAGRARLQRALSRFKQLGGDGSGGDGENSIGSLLGEGGEYETLVIDGPPVLFQCGSLCVADEDRRVVHEGGGSAWLQIRRAIVQQRAVEADTAAEATKEARVRQPDVLDRRFAAVVENLEQQQQEEHKSDAEDGPWLDDALAASSTAAHPSRLTTWCVLPEASSSSSSLSIADATQSIVDQVRRRLASHAPLSSSSSSSPTHRIDRTLVVLRRMADFPAFNAVYATLFASAPNPPARVTIACSDYVPAGVDVVVHFSVLDDSEGVDAERQGLHVQSRSYWAPANIGPYSQAVSLSLAQLQRSSQEDTEQGESSQEGKGPRLVSIAGQIPLLPATMELPDCADEAKAKTAPADVMPEPRPDLAAGPASFGFQTTLALQHLWRIGIEMDVQWWAGAVTYVPRQDTDATTTTLSLPDKAALVARAWHAAHAWQPEEKDEDEEDSGPDLWDRRFNAQYAGYGDAGGAGAGADAFAPNLPDWSVLRAGVHGSRHGTQRQQQANHTGPSVPPVFLAEICELPRAAPVEWHALAGLSHLPAGSLTCGRVMTPRESSKPTEYRTVISLTTTAAAATGGASSAVVQTIRTWPYPTAGAGGLGHFPTTAARSPDVVYVDMGVHKDDCGGGAVASSSSLFALPVVPCASLWNEHGERLAAVVVWTTTQTAVG